MPIEQFQWYCPACQRPTLLQRSTPNHLVHGLVTLFLCGLWLPIWFFAHVTAPPWRCQVCGSVVRPRSNANPFSALWWVILGLFIFAIGGAIFVALFGGIGLAPR